MSASDDLLNIFDAGGCNDPRFTFEEVADRILTTHARELAERQRAYAEEEWTGSDARMILRRRVARHLADLIDPNAGPVRPGEEPRA